jgi:hypothetical protein
MAGQNTSILASDYNSIQTKIARVLGPTVNDGTYGYGQTVTSTQVDTTKTIKVDQWLNLQNDIAKARSHQTGSDESFSSLQTPTTSKKVSESIRAAMLAKATDADTNRLAIAPSKASEVDIISPVVRSTAWNGSISHLVYVTFPSYDNARYFFNAGGQIRFSATLAGGTSASVNTKDWQWAQMFAAMTSVNFGATATTCVDTSSTSIVTPNAGFYNMTTTPVQIYNKAAPGTSAYGLNDYFLTARFTNSSQNVLEFYITLADSSVAPPSTPDPGFGIDENVTGTIYSYCKAFYPSGAGNVYVPAPPATTTAWA